MKTQFENATSAGLLILRLGTAGYMMTHGWGKVQMMMNRQYEAFGDPIGIGSTASLALVMFAKFICAALVLIGLGTRFAAIPPVIAMAVAAFVAHGNDPWTMQEAAVRFFSGQSQSWASKQPALMFLTGFLALVFTGPGAFSIDAVIARQRRS